MIMIIIIMRGEHFMAHLDGLGGTPVCRGTPVAHHCSTYKLTNIMTLLQFSFRDVPFTSISEILNMLLAERCKLNLVYMISLEIKQKLADRLLQRENVLFHQANRVQKDCIFIGPLVSRSYNYRFTLLWGWAYWLLLFVSSELLPFVLRNARVGSPPYNRYLDYTEFQLIV
jgi:hypothetical protein